MCEFLEELIRGEGEQLSEWMIEKDYPGLTPEQRHLLRLAAIARLDVVDLWLAIRQ